MALRPSFTLKCILTPAAITIVVFCNNQAVFFFHEKMQMVFMSYIYETSSVESFGNGHNRPRMHEVRLGPVIPTYD